MIADEQRSGALLERFRLAKAAAFDPWAAEAAEPHHPTQFSEIVGPPEEALA